MGQTAMWRLRRIAPRAAHIAQCYAQQAQVTARASTLLPALAAFVQAYDDVRHGDIPWAHTVENGRQAAYELIVAARMWLPLLVRDVAGVDRANYLDSSISDDIVEDVDHLVMLLRESRGAEGDILPYRDHAIEQIDRKFRAAQRKWMEAEAVDAEYAARMQNLRARALEFRAQLEGFTLTIAFVLGYTSPDYLRLLPSRASHLDSSDDRLAPRPEIVEPATLVTGVPRSLEA